MRICQCTSRKKFITFSVKETNSVDVCFNTSGIQNIPNIDFVYRKLIERIKRNEYVKYLHDSLW